MTYSEIGDSDLNDEDLQDSDFDWLANLYNSHGAINHPSELHGLMIGELVGKLRRTAGDWVSQVLGHMGVEELNTERQANVAEDLIRLYNKTSDTIEKDSSSFSLLLPDDEYELSERIDSLAVWVRGFLEGLAIASGEALAKVDEDLQEILKDFVEICQIDSRVSSGEEGEKELFEISEYVRIGVLNLYAEFNPPSGGDTPDVITNSEPTLH